MLRDYILVIPTTKKKLSLCDIIKVSANATMTITVPYINVSNNVLTNQQVVHLKFTQCYMSDVFQEKESWGFHVLLVRKRWLVSFGVKWLRDGQPVEEEHIGKGA